MKFNSDVRASDRLVRVDSERTIGARELGII